jgi:hypothetical protein
MLASGRRSRYQARLEPGPTVGAPKEEMHVVAGEVSDDLLPEGTVIGLGGLPWAALAELRDRAEHHQPPQQVRSAQGDGLPLLILGLDAKAGQYVAEVLARARPEGVALMEQDGEVMVIIVSGSGLYGVTTIPAADPAVVRFRSRLAATGGWHGIVMSTPTGDRGDPVYGFFECVLDQPADSRTRRKPARARAKKRQR